MSLGATGRSSTLGGSINQTELQERRRALRALLKRPLLGAHDPAFPLVRRHLDWLREWLSRNASWRLQVDGQMARLHKTPASPDDATRPAREPKSGEPFSRRRYVFWCLVLAALERADRQIALGRLADNLVQFAAADPALAEAGLVVDLEQRIQRRDLVHVVRLLLDLRILSRVEGHEDAYVSARGDVLYDIHRPGLAALLSVRRGPSLVTAEAAEARRAAIIEEPMPESAEGRNRRVRSYLTRKLLDDPVVYYEDLDGDQRAYLQSQRYALTSQIEEATGLVAEVRAEGLAMVDDRGDLTDVGLPEEGTDGHVALLVAEYLASHLARGPNQALTRASTPPVSRAQLEAHVAELIETYGKRWRQDARAPGAETLLVAQTLTRLEDLGLVDLGDGGIVPLPALGRFSLVEPARSESV
ncbi:MAG: TIGR02678 family protein [Acidobacteriota bacterium]